MRKSRRLHIGLSPALRSDLEAFASARGLTLGAAIRLLASEALLRESGPPVSVSPAALAALAAAEHAVLMVASILPEGERRMQALAEQAAQAAEERLAMFAQAGEP